MRCPPALRGYGGPRACPSCGATDGLHIEQPRDPDEATSWPARNDPGIGGERLAKIRAIADAARPPREAEERPDLVDLMQEAAADGRLDAHRLRPAVFGKSEGPPSRTAMLETVLRVANAAAEAADDAPMRDLYALAYRLESSTPAIDPAADPYPRARSLSWTDWEIATRARLLTEASRGLLPLDVARLLSVWLVTAPARKVVSGDKLLVAIEKKMRRRRWLDGKGRMIPVESNVERVIVAAMRRAKIRSSGANGPDKRKEPFRDD